MERKLVFGIGDKVQARDSRIGVVVDTQETINNNQISTSQTILVRFPDKSTVEGKAEEFKAVSERPFGNVK
jgi:hypothetical protein